LSCSVYRTGVVLSSKLMSKVACTGWGHVPLVDANALLRMLIRTVIQARRTGREHRRIHLFKVGER